MSQFVKYIQESYRKMKQFSIHTIPIVVKDDFVGPIDLEFVSKKVKSIIPANLIEGLDIIYVGEFDELEEKEVSALYLNGAIYITNIQTSEQDLIDDLVHEMAHFIEEKYTDVIYGDDKIEREFLQKRNKLFDILEHKGYDVPEKFRHLLEYDKTLDDYLYKFIGYPKLRDMIGGLFVSAYSTTDVREYFAISFENYFLGNKEDVFNITPNVYLVLQNLTGE